MTAFLYSPNGISVSGEVANEYDKLASEFIRRIYLPHMTIPHLTIPWLRDKIDVQSVDLNEINPDSDSATSIRKGCQLVFDSLANIMLTYEGDQPSYQSNANLSAWKAPENGWYEFSFTTNYSDIWNGSKTALVTITNAVAGNTTHYGSGSWWGTSGGGSQTTTVNACFYVKRGTAPTFTTAGTVYHIVGRRLSQTGLMSPTGSLVIGVDVLSATDTANMVKIDPSTNLPVYDSRTELYVKQDTNGRSCIEIEGVAVKYTRENKIGINPSGAPSEHKEIQSTLTDVTESPYENDAENNNKNGRGN